MRTLHDTRSESGRIRLLRVLPAAAVILWVATAIAAGQPETQETANQPKEEPIQITADQLITDNAAQYADFIGNVKVVQADWVITSDKLRIYYEGDLLNSGEKSDSKEKGNSTEQSLKKIVATGNVKIRSDQYSADSEKAEYDTRTMIITLSGEDSILFKGKNSITGSKIILYRKEGRARVEGSKDKRIKAVFYSEGKASDAFGLEKPKK